MAALPVMLRHARARLAELPPLPEPWDMAEFVERVAQHRGRPIQLAPRTMSHYASVATGLWIRRTDRDVIVYDTSGTELHQDHIVLHELAHMLCGHTGVPLHTDATSRDDDQDGDQQMLSRLSGDDVLAEESVRVLHRNAYDSAQELEAETLAYVIWQAAGLQLVSGSGPVSRAVAAFEYH
ncbi:hypothetical protein FHX42_005237 [Saccharopolyspora lacisalsi]|uniref:IrrE N-terminal-like domain-containing protein n=1 Tax=Halosaccharopolyspora lacisalsi TaxID=1000566 RepID=A0A839E464_9PSEU|nr:ImmA/IrrE family metallo-endopeptidase [Halosaccharopolyspora lacisalsi]MBA8827830.1 hypothetical protein [Halosaccharopolyspora lacisalsi]